jgi:hypothetical protein
MRYALPQASIRGSTSRIITVAKRGTDKGIQARKCQSKFDGAVRPRICRSQALEPGSAARKRWNPKGTEKNVPGELNGKLSLEGLLPLRSVRSLKLPTSYTVESFTKSSQAGPEPSKNTARCQDAQRSGLKTRRPTRLRRKHGASRETPPHLTTAHRRVDIHGH